jgi:hypothetical protein
MAISIFYAFLLNTIRSMDKQIAYAIVADATKPASRREGVIPGSSAAAGGYQSIDNGGGKTIGLYVVL